MEILKFGLVSWVPVTWMKLVLFQSTYTNPVTIAHGPGSKHSNTNTIHPCLPTMTGATHPVCPIKVQQANTTKHMSASGQARTVTVIPATCGREWFKQLNQQLKPR